MIYQVPCVAWIPQNEYEYREVGCIAIVEEHADYDDVRLEVNEQDILYIPDSVPSYHEYQIELPRPSQKNEELHAVLMVTLLEHGWVIR